MYGLDETSLSAISNDFEWLNQTDARLSFRERPRADTTPAPIVLCGILLAVVLAEQDLDALPFPSIQPMYRVRSIPFEFDERQLSRRQNGKLNYFQSSSISMYQNLSCVRRLSSSSSCRASVDSFFSSKHSPQFSAPDSNRDRRNQLLYVGLYIVVLFEQAFPFHR